MKICFAITGLLPFISSQTHCPRPCPWKELHYRTSSQIPFNLMTLVVYFVLFSKVSGSKGGSNNLCGDHESSDQQPGKSGLATFLCLCISITALNISISISVTNLNISISITTLNTSISIRWSTNINIFLMMKSLPVGGAERLPPRQYAAPAIAPVGCQLFI